MKDSIFLDTNILVYAHDLDAGEKHDTAMIIVERIWHEKSGIISVQVLQEFYITITRKILKPLSHVVARGLIKNYLSWTIALNDGKMILEASEIEKRYRLSFWDSLIIAAAYRQKADKILTEDLNHGQIIEGILIENPFI